MSIIVKEIFKSSRLTKVSNGVNIFNAMKSEVNKDTALRGFVLDFAGIEVVSPFVFSEVFRQMQSRLNGDYKVELQNANPLIVQSFKMAMQR